jgi:hypothetical protein
MRLEFFGSGLNVYQAMIDFSSSSEASPSNDGIAALRKVTPDKTRKSKCLLS